MRRVTALALTAAALLALGVGAFATRTAAPPADSDAGAPMFPDLAARLPTAERIEIVKGGRLLTLVDHDTVWRAPEQAGYPVDPGKLHGLLTALAELRLLEPRTADPAGLARLGLDDPAGSATGGTLIRVLTNDGDPVVAVIAGHAQGAGGQFVRRPDGNQSWLASPTLIASAESRDWIDPVIVDLPPERLAAIAATRGSQTIGFTVTAGHVAMTAPPSPLDPFRLAAVGDAWRHLTFTEVKRAAEMPGAAIGHADLAASDGTHVVAGFSLDGAQPWLTIAANGGDGVAARAINERCQGWAYAIPAEALPALLPMLGDLRAYAPPPEPLGPPAPSAPKPPAKPK